MTPRKLMTEEHKARMQAGRRARGTPKPRSSILAAKTIHGEGFETRLRQMPVSMRDTYRRAMSGKSRKAAVKAFCQECMGWENVATAIRYCTSPACPLYPYRPYREETPKWRCSPTTPSA